MNRQPSYVEWGASRVGDQAGHRLMVILAAPGCAYARRTGGCTNCSFAATLGLGHEVSSEELCAQLDEALAGIPQGVAGPVEIDLFCSGSFLNDEEIPPEAQTKLLQKCAAWPFAERLLIESRPEYVTDAALARAAAAAGGKALEIGIGLESASREIREQRIRKGFSWEQFQAAAEKIAAQRLALLVYVLLKPLDTNEGEAITDATETARRVFELGRELDLPVRVALEPCFVAPGTPVARAFEAGRFRPPWLWSVIAVVRAVSGLGPLQAGLSEEGMNPARAAHNCEKCSAAVRQALARFNLTQDAEPLAKLSCFCQAQWLAEVGQG